MRALIIPLAALAAIMLPAVADAQQPYAGQQAREIKALSPEEVADLLAGRGMGLAKAAELNHYPGPAHLLELSDALGLTEEQQAAVRAGFERMSEAARPLGAELVEQERALDRDFATGSITQAALARATDRIGVLEGRLRAVHLAAHLEMRGLLTTEQLARYDALRGYAAGPAASPEMHHNHGG